MNIGGAIVEINGANVFQGTVAIENDGFLHDTIVERNRKLAVGAAAVAIARVVFDIAWVRHVIDGSGEEAIAIDLSRGFIHIEIAQRELCNRPTIRLKINKSLKGAGIAIL